MTCFLINRIVKIILYIYICMYFFLRNIYIYMYVCMMKFFNQPKTLQLKFIPKKKKRENYKKINEN